MPRVTKPSSGEPPKTLAARATGRLFYCLLICYIFCIKRLLRQSNHFNRVLADTDLL